LRPLIPCTQLAKQRSARAGKLSLRFGIFLWACGCPRSVIDVLAQLGLCPRQGTQPLYISCPSFSSIHWHDTLAALSRSAFSTTIAAIHQHGVAWLNGYDNLNACTFIDAAQQYLGSRPKVENFAARSHVLSTLQRMMPWVLQYLMHILVMHLR
jgi:hypothetical protein